MTASMKSPMAFRNIAVPKRKLLAKHGRQNANRFYESSEDLVKQDCNSTRKRKDSARGEQKLKNCAPR